MDTDKFIDVEKLIASKNPKVLKWIPRFVLRYLKRIIHQDEVNKLAQELISKNEDHNDPKQDATNEMGEKIKGYFDSNPNEAAKIFKSMLKNK